MFFQRERVLQQGEQDLALQRDRLSKDEELEELEQEQLQALEDILDASTLASGNSGALVASLEAGSSPESAAETLYGPVDPNPGAGQMFGDASGSIEELIIRAAQETHHMSGVRAAGLSPKQWRCLLQALIWQETGLVIYAKQVVGFLQRSRASPLGLCQAPAVLPRKCRS